MSAKLKELFDKVQSLTEQINILQSDKADVLQEIAEASCPFKEGDILRGQRGLAKTSGVRVERIIAPPYSGRDNQWAIETVALTKEGLPSRRIVVFDERAMPIDLLEKQP